MKIKINFLQVSTILTLLLFVYTTLSLIEQTHQSVIILNPQKLEIKKALYSKPTILHLKKLGLSEIAISHMSQSDVDHYHYTSGKVVYQETIYRKLDGDMDTRLSKKEYNQLVKIYANSLFPHLTRLEKIHISLLSEGNNKYSMISEQHYDYCPHDLKPLQVRIELSTNYRVLNQIEKQIWWSASMFNPQKIKTGATDATLSTSAPQNQMFEYSNSGLSQMFSFSVPWKQSSLFQDVVALHFFTISEFEVPKEDTVISGYLQEQDPLLSEEVQFIKKKGE